MTKFFYTSKKVKQTESLLCVKSLYPLAYKDFKTYFEQINPDKADLFLSLMTRDTYCQSYYLCFYKFFINYSIPVLSDFDIVLHCFNVLNDRLSALKN